MLVGTDNMAGKWQFVIFLGQQAILKLQEKQTMAKFVLRFQALGTNIAIPKGHVLDDTRKQCYNVENQTVISYLFLSSSPSVRCSEHCFLVLSRVADVAKIVRLLN